MADPTTRNGFRKPEPGTDTNVWGSNLNSGVFDLVDAALDGWTTISATGTTILSSTQYVENQARMRMLRYTGDTTGTLVIPGVEKWYIVYATQADCIISNGGDSVTVPATSMAIVITDGSDIWIAETRVYTGNISMGGNKITNLATPTANTDASTKKYVDDQAFATQSGSYPGQSGNAGNFLTTDGTSPSWASPFPSQASNSGKYLQTNGTAVSWASLDFASATEVRAGTTSTKIVGPGQLRNAESFSAVTGTGTVTLDLATGPNFSITVTGNMTLAVPSNMQDGQSGTIWYTIGGAGSYTLTLNAAIKKEGSAPVLPTTVGAVASQAYQVRDGVFYLWPLAKTWS